MTKLAWMPWCEAIDQILPGVLNDDWDETQITVHELHDLWEANMSPVEAAAAITVAEFERSLNA